MMELKLTDEQFRMLLENETFISSFSQSLAENMVCNFQARQALIGEIIPHITKTIVKSRISTDNNITRVIDRRVMEALDKFVSGSIGRVIFDLLKAKDEAEDKEAL